MVGIVRKDFTKEIEFKQFLEGQVVKVSSQRPVELVTYRLMPDLCFLHPRVFLVRNV